MDYLLQILGTKDQDYIFAFDVMSSRTIEEVLQEERKKTTVKVGALTEFLYTPEALPAINRLAELPGYAYDPNVFNKSRVDMVKYTLDQAYQNYSVYGGKYDYHDYVNVYGPRHWLQIPYSLHVSMFIKCMEILGTDGQQKEWVDPAKRFEVVGCYAQTELGHGSDVQSLETTATYVMEKDAFIMNTPTISAAKWWPGDLGIICTHALVFAQMIVRKKNHGVHAFLVPVRDPKTMKVLPGIEVGDIGPKIGFSTKDNGYLLMSNVIIPKTNMLRRFTSVSKQGQIKQKGDPKVSYATMMIIRQSLSCTYPKVYAMSILIAGRYAMFRKQFKNSSGQEIPIIDYQTQKDKIISRVAEYYAVMAGGNAIRTLSERNLQLVQKNNDFSLMAESHVCLCLGKAFFGEVVYDGMETCRRACGGHGFSHYSGLPNLVLEYAANLTLEGENTILYLQIARYLLKNYKYAMTGKKEVGPSVSYLANFAEVMEKRVAGSQWSLADLHLLLSQAACYLLQLSANCLMNKPDGWSSLDVWNKKAGIELKRLSVCHSVIYTYNAFKNGVEQHKSPENKAILTQLCQLFGINSVISFSSVVTEAGFITPHQLTSLLRLKEQLLDAIRPQLAGLIDSFNVPQHLIRSALTSGDPYKNMLDLARDCEINKETTEAALTIRENIQRAIASHQPEQPAPKL